MKINISEKTEKSIFFNRCQIGWMKFLSPTEYMIIDYLLYRSNLSESNHGKGWRFRVRDIIKSTGLSSATVCKQLKTFPFVTREGENRNMNITFNKNLLIQWDRFKNETVNVSKLKQDSIKNETVNVSKMKHRSKNSTNNINSTVAYNSLKKNNSIENNVLNKLSPGDSKGGKEAASLISKPSICNFEVKPVVSVENTNSVKKYNQPGRQAVSIVDFNLESLKKHWNKFNKAEPAKPVDYLPQTFEHVKSSVRPQGDSIRCPIDMSAISGKVKKYNQPGRQAVSIVDFNLETADEIYKKNLAKLTNASKHVGSVQPVEHVGSVQPVEHVGSVQPVEHAVSELKVKKIELLNELKELKQYMDSGLRHGEARYVCTHYEEVSDELIQVEASLRKQRSAQASPQVTMSEFDQIFGTIDYNYD
jgi:hypothetical protein